MPVTQHPPLDLASPAGQPLTIELRAMPGAGLMWQMPAAPDGCTLTEGDLVPDSAGIGGEARQRFVLTCARPGRHALEFQYKRPWEDVVRAVRTVNVAVG